MAECYNKIYLKDKDIEVNCGKCLNCLENKKREKADRFVLEMKDYPIRTFITLTYDEVMARRNKEGKTTLCKRDLNNYIKKLQYAADRFTAKGEKKNMIYIASGEYGAATDRAHYHVVVASKVFLNRTMKFGWKFGHVQIETLKDVKAVYYTAGYVDKKQGFNKDWKYLNKDREIAFTKTSRGLGKEWIHEAIATKKVSWNRYYLEMTFKNKSSLPQYFKQKIKESVMGVIPRYYKLKTEERLYRKIHFGENRKTIMLNQNAYDENKWKWELFIEKVIKLNKQRDVLYYDKERLIDRKDNWKTRLYNLMFNEGYNETDIEIRDYSELIKQRRENLKIAAEQKYFRNINKRIAV